MKERNALREHLANLLQTVESTGAEDNPGALWTSPDTPVTLSRRDFQALLKFVLDVDARLNNHVVR